MRDVTVFNEGRFPANPATDADAVHRASILDRMKPDGDPEAARNLEAARTERPQAASEATHHAGAHDTAMAGLVGAWLAHIPFLDPAMIASDSDQARLRTVALPYVGINPCCSIMPVSTTAAPDPGMVLAALTYARLICADIVVVAQAWAEDAIRATNKAAWDAVEVAFGRLAERSIIFCAASNSGGRSIA